MELATRLKPRQLRLIQRIGETRQLQTAAHMLAMSQPAASRVLAEIEAEVGTPLFTRHPKGMEPTLIGETFLRHARVILSELESLETEVAGLRSGEGGEVRVGSVTGPTVGVLVPAIRAVRTKAPGIQATVEVGPSGQLVRGLEEGRFDFVIARLPPEYDSRQFRIDPARNEVVSLVVRAGHPALGERRKLSELVGYEWVIQDLGTPIRVAMDGAFHAAGLAAPEQITNSSSLLVALSILEGTDAIAPQSQEVADLLTRNKIGDSLATLELAEPLAVSPCFIIRARARQMSRAAERVMQEVFRRL
ncbi:LysR substrate-binding domain-containing protein [Vannielia litorea]|uniref:LysR substrate-binding domain-containing protein n=1 Tax=Vannielia litorea TaxID=1217970 RepID=UPI001C989EAA|nr:LysR substrate-binding domain-containing protein [Vannielia litorea]MBY6048942.1 LysR family transcriptional regulator [Vannielia litorea]MBY6076356.1 LysR family transcriptional regulator [Vannielia litorea]